MCNCMVTETKMKVIGGGGTGERDIDMWGVVGIVWPNSIVKRNMTLT